jgi:hypothetical protein
MALFVANGGTLRNNTTCDVYRSGRAPPAAPDVSGVLAYLVGSYYKGLEHGEKDAASFRYSHLLLVELTADLRDDYDAGSQAGTEDHVWIPDKNGVNYKVIFVERRCRGAVGDCKRVYLARQSPTSASQWAALPSGL